MPANSRRLAVLVTALALVATTPSSAVIAADGWKNTSKTRYTLLPDEGKVSFDAKITLRNQKKSTTAKGPCEDDPRRTCKIKTDYYADGWGTILVPPEATDLQVTGKGVEPITLGTIDAGSMFRVSFPRLFYKKKQGIGLAFDLLDSGPASGRPTRITDSYAHFCWHGVHTETGSIEIDLPPGWTSQTAGAEVETTTDLDGTTIRTSSKKLPGAVYACTDTFLPGAMQRIHQLAPGGQVVTISAWPDDSDWAGNVTEVLTDGLPALEATIGSPMPFASLTIQEVARTNGFGAPADLDVAGERLLMDEDFDFAAAPLATLARTWFEDGSISDSWLAEGLSLWAGLSTAGYECPDPGAYPAQDSPNLLDWQVGLDNTSGNPVLPVYQVNAACTIVEDVAIAIGPAHMAEVIDSLRAGTPRYGDRASDPRTPWAPADWTDWLDAVDELGLVPAGQPDLGLAERALTQYGIASPETLMGRLSARTLYHDTLANMNGTAMPTHVDRLMESWAFGDAVDAILESKRVHGTIASHPTLTDEARATFLTAFEATPSATGLAALEASIEAWTPPPIGE